MIDVRYEPLPPTVVYQRFTREGHFILYFIPAETEEDRFDSGTTPATTQPIHSHFPTTLQSRGT